MSVPPLVGSSSGIVVNSGLRWTCGTRGLNRLLKPLMKPMISTLRWLARTTAPWIVALSAGVSPPAVRMPMRFIRDSAESKLLARWIGKPPFKP